MDDRTLSILIVESHPLMRAALWASLASEANLAVVAEAAAVGEAVQAAQRLRPDLILFSLDEVAGNNLEALEALCNALPGVSIVALSSDVEVGLPRLAARAGASLLLPKSTPREELIRALREIEHLSRLSAGVYYPR